MKWMKKMNLTNQSLGGAVAQSDTRLQMGVVFAVAIAHMLVDIMTNVIPMLLTLMQQTFHLSYTQLGVIVMVNMICTSLIQPVFGYISDRKPLVWLMSAGALTTGLGLVIFAFAPSYYVILLGVAISGM